MPPRALSAGLLLLLLAATLAPPGGVLAPGVAAQPAGDAPDEAPPDTPFVPLPAPVLSVGGRWLEDATDALAAAEARAAQAKSAGLDPVRADQFVALLRARHLGAWDFLNESRLDLAMSQLAQVPVEAALLEAFATAAAAAPAGDAGADLNRTARRLALQAAWEAGNESRAAVDAFLDRLARDEARLRTTRGLELALLSASTALQGEAVLRSLQDLGEQVNRSAEEDERVLRFLLGVMVTPASYAAWADDLLDLAMEEDAAPGAPSLPEGVKASLRENVTARLEDPDLASTTGLHSSRAKGLADRARENASVVLYAARYLAFQQMRSSDALTFLQGQGRANAAALRDALDQALTNASLAPRYDGRLQALPAEASPMAARLETAGYQGVARTDARNHAAYSVVWEPAAQPTTFGNLLGAWTALVGAHAASDLLVTSAASPAQAPQGEPPWLMLGGVAVVVALAVLAVAFLRRPGGA